MDLYFSPLACSMATRIALYEAGAAAEYRQVDTKAKRLADGSDFRPVNPMGQVPVLRADDGSLLTENAAVLQYVADRHPQSGLAPKEGFARYDLQRWLNFITSELHKTYSPLFNPDMPEAAKAIFKDKLKQRYAFIAKRLDQHDYLLGTHFTVADAYLYVVTRWARHFDIDVTQWPSLAQFMDRVGARAGVKLALNAESQAKKAA